MVMRIESNLYLANDSTPKGDDWWEWSVWVEGPSDELDQIQSVTYRLHPTFPNPIREVRDAASKFKLSSAGWGEFAILADVKRKDGRTLRVERWLELLDDKGLRRTDPAVTGKQRPTVFISHSVADGGVVQSLRNELTKQGVDVWTGESIEAKSDVALEIRECLKKADVIVPLVSDPQSRFVEEEARTALDAGRKVLPVVLGNARMPDALRDLYPRFEMPESKNITGLANRLAAMVKDMVVPEEK